MPDRHEVICINKSDRMNPHERITHIGGRNGDGTAWKLIAAGRYCWDRERQVVVLRQPGGRTVNVIAVFEPVRSQVPQDRERRRAARQPPQPSRMPVKLSPNPEPIN